MSFVVDDKYVEAAPAKAELTTKTRDDLGAFIQLFVAEQGGRCELKDVTAACLEEFKCLVSPGDVAEAIAKEQAEWSSKRAAKEAAKASGKGGGTP